MVEHKWSPQKERSMRRSFLFTRELVMALHEEESAQDVIEYALLASHVALGAVIGIEGVSSSINTGFSLVNSKIHSQIGKHLGCDK